MADPGRADVRRNLSLASQSSADRPRRQKSLVRPERERIDATHRQYHYRQRAQHRGSDHIEPSTTGNQPTRKDTGRKRYAADRHGDPNAAGRAGGATGLHRGNSILGRSEKHAREDTDEDLKGGAIDLSSSDRGSRIRCSEGALWLTYCRLLTCCIPGCVLTICGIPKGQAQTAWREKIGLLSFIAVVMGFVGFLTFGFTQAVCPTPPETVHGGSISKGYLVIRGWAYLLAGWNNHPAIPGQTSNETNILYAPIDAGGMDASFLFQEIRPESCAQVLKPKSSRFSTTTTQAPDVYFPCQMFNPNDTTIKQLTYNAGVSACHLSPTARSTYQQFQTSGVPRSKGGIDKAARLYYDWDNIHSSSNLMVYNGDVLNLNLLGMLSVTKYDIGPNSLIQHILNDMSAFGGKDMTRHIAANRMNDTHWEKEAECLATLIKVGSVDTLSIGCMASEIVLYLSLVVILGVILTRFSLAIIFGWFLSWRLGNFKEERSYSARMQRERELEQWSRDIHAAPIQRPRLPQPAMNSRKKSLLPQTSRFTQPAPNSTRFDAERPTTPVWKTPSTTLEDFSVRRHSYFASPTPSPSPSSRYLPAMLSQHSFTSPMPTSMRRSSLASSTELHSHSNGSSTVVCPYPLSPHTVPQPPLEYMPFNYPLAHTICLVTCYSEGHDGIRTTLDSIATSDYPNSHKLMLVVCDGIITGHGEEMSTPDICVGMMRDLLVPADEVEPLTYIAVADGARRNNMAKVYAGFYQYDDATVDPAHQQRVPMITIVKCGTPEEADEKKPGNRGKRDSQIILMQFMQKVIFDERMTTMEYCFFNSIWRITGVPADRYELTLMVDADTKLFPDALSRLISCAVKDPDISGLCGETRIANKTAGWVSMIQVFEYYISHHQSKAFESIFGGVTCLPGCFCMYRIKAPKGPNGYWVPILANPDIVEHYSENVVDTLHKKNLLLLGEDRYLSTLMLKTFPQRKMMFVPQAACKTVVPDTFKVLLSQRRRWINSTIHNLMELVLVHDLCGTFCFSMQFVVFMELVGTLALPAAISFTLYLIILAIMGQPAIIPLILLALILGLPALLILMTSRKIVYVGWMLIYLLSLPVWNFVLPTYAYWHFDDFSWGDTRKVQGQGKSDRGHAEEEGEFDSSRVVMKKWGDYEKERRVQTALQNNLPPPKFAMERPRSCLDITQLTSAPATPYDMRGSSTTSSSDSPLLMRPQPAMHTLNPPSPYLSFPEPQHPVARSPSNTSSYFPNAAQDGDPLTSLPQVHQVHNPPRRYSSSRQLQAHRHQNDHAN